MIQEAAPHNRKCVLLSVKTKKPERNKIDNIVISVQNFYLFLETNSFEIVAMISAIKLLDQNYSLEFYTRFYSIILLIILY